MDSLPIETLFKIALYLPLDDLSRLEKTCHYFYELCLDDTFWYHKNIFDYPQYNIKYSLLENFSVYHDGIISWKKFYVMLNLGLIKKVPLYYNDKYLIDIWLSLSQKYTNLIQNILHILDLYNVLYAREISDQNNISKDFMITFNNNLSVIYPNRLIYAGEKPINQILWNDCHKITITNDKNTIKDRILRACLKCGSCFILKMVKQSRQDIHINNYLITCPSCSRKMQFTDD